MPNFRDPRPAGQQPDDSPVGHLRAAVVALYATEDDVLIGSGLTAGDLRQLLQIVSRSTPMRNHYDDGPVIALAEAALNLTSWVDDSVVVTVDVPGGPTPFPHLTAGDLRELCATIRRFSA